MKKTTSQVLLHEKYVNSFKKKFFCSSLFGVAPVIINNLWSSLSYY